MPTVSDTGEHPGTKPTEEKPAAPNPPPPAVSDPLPEASPPSPPAKAPVPRTPPVCQRCPVTYPPALERAGIEGTVKVRILVDEKGRVEKAEVVGTVRRELREAALDTVKKWSFHPGTRAGVPGRMDLVVPVTFRLGGGSSQR